MVKVKFSELKVGDEYYNLKDKGNIRKMIKTGERSCSSPCHDYQLDFGKDFDVWIRRFKDRFGKDLSVGDRVLICSAYHGGGVPIPELIDTVITSLYEDGELIIINEEGTTGQNIVKIESHWGI